MPDVWEMVSPVPFGPVVVSATVASEPQDAPAVLGEAVAFVLE